MALISPNKLSTVVTEFIDTRLMPSAPAHIKWILGGSTYLILNQMEAYKEQYAPSLKKLGIVTSNDQLDIGQVSGFLTRAFEKSPEVEMFGFKFTKADGIALVDILNKHQDTVGE